MGRDIHTHIEVKLHNKWLHYSAPSVPRVTDLYNMLINGDYDTSLPGDASEITRLSHEQDNKRYVIHDLRVIPAESLEDLQVKFSQSQCGRNYSLDTDLEHSIFRTYINGNSLAEHQGYQDLRIICWFDN